MPTEAVLAARARAPLRLSGRRLQNSALWLLTLGGGLVFIEPSPYEIFFLLAAGIFALTGLRFHRMLTPLLLALVLFNIGGLLSLIPYTSESASVSFVLISIYMGVTAVFFACVMLDNTAERIACIQSGTIAAATIASVTGIIGYFATGPIHELFTKFDRATGTFKDPNVIGPFLILPILWLLQRIMLGRHHGARQALPAYVMTTLLPLGVIMAALFLTFSRGAWGVAVLATAMMVFLTFLTSVSPALRLRMVVLGAVGLAILLVAFAIALSIPAIREIFEVRASLSQDYDGGEMGRFGAQMRSIPLLLESPNGFGPLRFAVTIGNEDPHNVYVNAFASYGWLGGLSYLALVFMTLLVGWRAVLLPSRWQTIAIPVWSCLFAQILQGLQIDTDHWRHLYMMFGLIWGIAALIARDAQSARSYLRASA